MATVTVACKLPNGHNIEIPGAAPILLNGANSASAVAGFGLTEVDSDYWDKYAELYADFPALKKGLIFAQAKAKDALAAAKEKADEKTGFEGLNPEAPGANLQTAV